MICNIIVEAEHYLLYLIHEFKDHNIDIKHTFNSEDDEHIPNKQGGVSPLSGISAYSPPQSGGEGVKGGAGFATRLALEAFPGAL